MNRLLMVVTILLACASASAFAGAVNNYDFCYQAPDGHGYCEGTFAGFRNDPNPNAYVSFAIDATSGSYDFYASTNGQYFFCEAVTQQIQSLFHDAIASQSSFIITWNTANVCMTFAVEGTSAAH